MPHARSSTVIDAPYDRVAALLADKVEWPRKYVGIIQSSRILERGDGYVVREMYQPAPTDLTITEKIWTREVDGGEETVFEHVGNALYSGTLTNVLTRIPGDDSRVRLEFIQDWTPHDGLEDPIDDAQAARNMTAAVEHLKHIAENPVEVPDFVRRFYTAVDTKDGAALAATLAENLVFRIGSNADVLGRDAWLARGRDFPPPWTGIRHDFASVAESGGRTFVECWVTYTMPDDATYVLPFLTVFERDGELISTMKVFGDLSPIFAGWPGRPVRNKA